MILKKSQFYIQDKNSRDLDNADDYSTLAESTRDQNCSDSQSNTVHYRRDLDSLG